MNGNQFDRLARQLQRPGTRRGFIGLIAALVATLGGKSAHAAQLGPATCGASGAVCTMLMGCCDGLTCVTSAINTNYGVCVPGDGGTAAAGTSLISPYSETLEQEIASLSEAATTDSTSTTDLQAEREAKLAEKRTRRETHRDEIRARRDKRQDRRDDQRDTIETRRGPKLELELQLHAERENLKVRNASADSAYIESIEASQDAGSKSSVKITLGAGDSFVFQSGVDIYASDGVKLGWRKDKVCPQGQDDVNGFTINAAYTSSDRNVEYEILCSQSVVAPRGSDKKKRKKNKRRGTGKRGRGKNSKK